MKKILALTSIRSDYDLMSGLYQQLNADPDIDLQLLVSGTHLSSTFGLTVNLIKQDGFKILAEIESLLHSDSHQARLKSASIMLQSAVDIVAAYKPDLILYAGDREDVLMGAMLGVYLHIPTVHFFGGDHEKDGHADTVVRHATSKLSTFHIASTEQHKQRLQKLGESKKRIFVAGSIALDKFVQANSKVAIKPNTILPAGKNLNGYAMVIYHPVDAENAGQTFEHILSSLKKARIPAIVSYPNSDPGHESIINCIRQHEHDPDFWFYTNLERDVFLSLYKQAAFLIGNSSSGILEAASIPLGVINVGARQKGRYSNSNVVFCSDQAQDITHAIELVRSAKFQASLSQITNSYGDGQSCEKVVSIIKTTDFARLINKTEDPLEINDLCEKS